MYRTIRISRLSLQIAVLLPVSNLALAQSEAVDLDSVSVTGVRASIQQSLLDKHSAGGIVDTISAEDIGKFPDLNLSESLQRISGITLDRNNVGEGSTINLRGLGPEFTRVEINGMSGMSSGGEHRTQGSIGGSRAFNFEMFSSELFSKATVYKTGMAEVDEGGLAGTVRLETPRPLDSQGTRMAVSALGNYSEFADSINPRTAVMFSHNHNDVFGIAASMAWAQTDFSSSVVEAASWKPFADYDNTGIPETDPEHSRIRDALVPLGPLYFSFNQDRKTTGSTLTLQFRPNEQINISIDGMYGKLKNTRLQLREDMPIDQGVTGITNAVIEDGVIVSGDFSGVQQRVGTRFVLNNEEYQQIVARLEWMPNEYWSIRPSLGYAKREADEIHDLYSFRLANNNGDFDPGTVSYRLRGDFIDFASSATDFVSNPENFLFNVFIMNAAADPAHNRSQEKQARVDFDRHFSGNDHILKFGLRYNDHMMERSTSLQFLFNDGTIPTTQLPDLTSVLGSVRFRVPGSIAPSPLLTVVNRNRVRDVFMPGGVPIPGTFLVDFTGTAAQGSYRIQEKTGSAWMQMDLAFDELTLIPGIRHVRTEQISGGFDVVNADLPTQVITPVRIAKTHHGWLPSLSARYDLNQNVVFRTAYARTLTRPDMASMAPYEYIQGIPNGTGERGNPNLEPYYANNFDLGGEWYFSSEGLLAVNVFYKKISNFIDTRTFVEERTFPRQETGIPITSDLTFTEPVNGVSASVKGAEISIQSRFSWLPGAWGNFGGIFNYSHTDSSANFSEQDDIRSQGLPGLSKNSINATLYYDNRRFDTRLTYAWRDRYLAEFNDLGGVPRFTKDYGQLDLSLNYRITDNLSIQAQVLNLTEEKRIDQSTTRYLPYSVAAIDRRFLLGIRATF